LFEDRSKLLNTGRSAFSQGAWDATKDLPLDTYIYSEENYAEKYAESVGFLDMARILSKPVHEELEPFCDTTHVTFTSLDGSEIGAYFIIPKDISETENNACFIYAHGGGAILFSASDWLGEMREYACRLHCVAVVLDFRKGPEYRCPKG